MRTKLKILLLLQLVIPLTFTVFSQTTEYDRVKMLKANSDTVKGKITGVWIYSQNNNQIHPQFEFYTNDDNKQLLIYPSEKIDTIHFYNPRYGKMSIKFNKPISRELINYFIEFEHEVARLTKEVNTASKENKLINFTHMPSLIVDLELKFKELISKPNNSNAIMDELNNFKYKWYENFLKENKLDAELTLPGYYIPGYKFDEYIRKSIVNGNSRYINRQYYIVDYNENLPFTDWIFQNDLLVEKKEYKLNDTLKFTLTTYYPDLTIKSTGRIQDGMREGLWKYYDKDGKPVRREKYRNNVLISEK